MDLTLLEAQARATIDAARGVVPTRAGDPVVRWSETASTMARGVLELLGKARTCDVATEALSRLTDASLPVDLYLGLHGKMTTIEREDRERFCEAFRLALRALPHTPDAAEDYPT